MRRSYAVSRRRPDAVHGPAPNNVRNFQTFAVGEGERLRLPHVVRRMAVQGGEARPGALGDLFAPGPRDGTGLVGVAVLALVVDGQAGSAVGLETDAACGEST